jgi:glycosyltransferase involved in cell wall biosynthesis
MDDRLRRQAPSTPDPDSDPSAGRGHVLLVAYFFPPAAGGGIPRPVKMAKYLQRLGWKVTVLTVARPGVVDPLLTVEPAAVVSVREWPLGPLLRLIGGTLRLTRRAWEAGRRRRGSAPSLLDRGYAQEEVEIEASHAGWVVPGLRAALRVHRRDPFDVAVVSSPPASSGAIGWALRALRGVPYVVEYRDPWTVGAFWTSDADGNRRTDPGTRLRYALARRLEAALLRRSSGAVIVNGGRHVERLRRSFPRETAGKQLVQIRNGVDLEDLRSLPARATSPAIRLLHTGFFYYFHSPHHVVEALRRVNDSAPEALRGVVVEFMGGGFPDRLAEAAAGWGLGDVVAVTPARPYSLSLRAMREADGVLVVLPPLDSYVDCIPTKVYEYLGTGSPILAAVAADGATAELLRDVPAAAVADNRDVAALARAIVAFVEALRARRRGGAVGDPGAPAIHHSAIHHYGERAAEMDVVLRRALARALAGEASTQGAA